MKKLISRPLYCLVTVRSLKMLILNIFLLRDEDYRHLFNAVGICNSVIFVEMGSIMEVV